MSDISSIGSSNASSPSPGRGIGSINRTGPVPAHQRHSDAREPGQTHSSQGDRVELSDHARSAGRVREEPGVRSDLVAKMRQAIEDPNYLSDDRLNTALNRLLAEVEENNAY